MRKISILLSFLVYVNGLAMAQEVDINLYQEIPMRDGVRLSANIFMPSEREEPLPVILIYTPYVNDEAMERGMFFAKQGYVFVSLDLRGRGNSEGVYAPFEKDGMDGFDAIEWIAKQPWSNGKVGMMGGSYRGMVQWLTLKERPAALRSMVPTASVGPGLDFPKSNGIFHNYNLQWLTFTSGRSRNGNLFGNTEFWRTKARKKFNNYLPFNQWDKIALGKEHPVFQKWISHPDFDRYWSTLYPTAADYQLFDLPILTITGYFDGDQRGAMTYYDDHMKYGSAEGKAKHYLVLGPWDHAGTRNPVTTLGGFVFGENSRLDLLQLHLEWFDWTLKDKDKPEFLKDRVTYYVMDENKWNYESTYVGISKDTLTYYLSSPSSEAKDLMQAGRLLTNRPGKESADAYTYDPLDTLSYPGYEGSDFFKAPIAISTRDRLVYVSEALPEETILVGQAEFGAYIELDVKDTDIEVSLYELMANGETNYLGRDRIRARYRHSLERAEMVVPGRVERYTFDDFPVTARVINRESRLVLIVSAVADPSVQKNYNSGKDVATESGEDAVTARVKLHHSNRYPTYIKLPVR